MPKLNDLPSVLAALSALPDGAKLVRELFDAAGQASEVMHAQAVLRESISQERLQSLLAAFDAARERAQMKVPALGNVLNSYNRLAIVALIELKIPDRRV